MNYLTLRRTIWIVATLALLLSGVALVIVLRMTWGEGEPPDFAGAGALAIVIPSFAGALLAAISIYAYINSEDPVLQESERVILSAQKLQSLFDSWIATIGLAWQTGSFEALKPVLERTSEIVIDLLHNHHILAVLSAKYDNDAGKQGIHHAASRLVLAIQLVCSSKPGTDPASLKLPSGENVLGVLLQAIDKLLDAMSGLPSAEEIRSIIARSRKAAMTTVLAEVMREAHVPKWS